MKKYLFTSIFILAGLLFFKPVLAVEQIDNFDVDVKVNQDASIAVSEKIEYDFGTVQKHGRNNFKICIQKILRGMLIPAEQVSIRLF